MELESKIINHASVIIDKQNPPKLKATRLRGDASDRSYFRLASKEGSYILMKMKNGFNSPAEEITSSSREINELPFINVHRFLNGAKVPVPAIIGFDIEAGIIVLEDLGDESLYDIIKDLNKNEIGKIYERLITELVRFQSAPAPSFPCIAFYRKYDREMCIWELEHFTQWGIEKFLKIRLPQKEARVIMGFYTTIADEFLAQRFCFTHRDYHSKNIMMKGNAPYVIDFQDALLAPLQYDLASLLRDSYVKLEEGMISNMIEIYMNKMADTSSYKIEPEGFIRAFDIVSMHRNLKAAGRFVFIEKKKSNPSYIKYIPSTLDNVKSNLSKYDDLKEGKSVLVKYIELIKEKVKSDGYL